MTRLQMAALLRLLRDCAERGRPCPSRRDIARRVRCGHGERGRRRARYLIDLLKQDGKIGVELRGHRPVVTIHAAGRGHGKCTAEFRQGDKGGSA